MKSLHKLIIGGLLVGATSTLIYAAPDDLGGTDTTTSTVPAQKVAQMSPQEMAVSADEIIENLHGMLRHVTQLHDKAAKEKDIIKLNCINDKLMPMKGEVNLADGARRTLEQAIGSNDDSGRYAAYSDLTIGQDKVRDYRDQADACVGDALTYVGKTEVDVSGPNNPLEPGDSNWGSGIEPPGYRTPFD